MLEPQENHAPNLNSEALESARKKEQFLLLGLTSPALLAVFLIIFIPVGWLFSLSFFNMSGEFTLENYQKMLVYKSYARVFAETFKVSTLTTLLCIIIGYPLAYFLSELPKKYASIFMLAVLLPFWTSLLVRTYAWLVLLQRKGLVNNFAIEYGLWDAPVKLVHNLNGTLIGMVHIMLPFLVLPLYGAMKRIDRQTIQAAANLGATPVQSFWQVFVPLSLSGVVAGSLIVFVLCLGFYVTPAVLGGGKVIMVSMQITAILEDQFNWGAASALGVVLLVTTFAVLALASRVLKLDNIMFGKT
jgi:putative spermidine/putrescine transport system permease protein/spermidine/putrescine transport system permease protein|tara:strand:+ start:2677 stop:3579 length:903 start_codon:yes stop_codon:yes gene_type:complete